MGLIVNHLVELVVKFSHCVYKQKVQRVYQS